MADQQPLPVPTLDDARAEVGRLLSDHFAEDRITVEEFERRLELIFKATTVEGVRAQLDGLSENMPPVSSSDDASRGSAVAPYQPSSRSKTFVSFMSGISRKGTWNVPAALNVVAFMGAVELDFRNARLGPVTNIRVVAFMGGVEITVGSNVRVETDGFAFMGGFEDRVQEPEYLDPAAPVLRVTGLAFMGGVDVRVKVVEPDRWR